MQLIDLTRSLDNNKHWAPWWMRASIRRRSHAFGALAARLVFGVPAKFLKNRLAWADEVIRLSTHAPTHVDAPWHYAPASEEGPAKTIDQVPLTWCYGDGVVLDLTGKPNGEAISVGDLQEALRSIHYTLRANDIVLVHTGNDRRFGTPEYYTQGTGVGADATRWIIDQGVRMTGIDSWSWDVPPAIQARRARKSGRPDLFWQAHFASAERGGCHIEGLTNLDKLPPYGFKVCAFPLKVKGGSAGPARVVAIVEDTPS